MSLDQIVFDINGDKLFVDVALYGHDESQIMVVKFEFNGKKYFARYDYDKGRFFDDVFGNDWNQFSNINESRLYELREEVNTIYGAMVQNELIPIKSIDLLKQKFP